MGLTERPRGGNLLARKWKFGREENLCSYIDCDTRAASKPVVDENEMFKYYVYLCFRRV